VEGQGRGDETERGEQHIGERSYELEVGGGGEGGGCEVR
jgi:hypothetical protein